MLLTSIFAIFVFTIFCVRSKRSKDSQVCACSICTCKCAVTFRRDQLQSIHHAKDYEEHENKKQQKNSSIGPTAEHSIMRELTSTITSTAADSILKVLQSNSPVKQERLSNQFMPYSTDLAGSVGGQYDSSEILHAIERSLGVTALSLCNDNHIAGNIQLKNELREGLGGTPTTHLLRTVEITDMTLMPIFIIISLKQLYWQMKLMIRWTLLILI